MRAIATHMTSLAPLPPARSTCPKLEGMKWYKPVDRGLEIKIAEKLARLESLNEEARKAGRGRRRGQAGR